MNPSPTLSLNHAKTIRGYGSGNEDFSIAIIWSRSSYSKVPSLRSLNRVRLLGCGVRRFRRGGEGFRHSSWFVVELEASITSSLCHRGRGRTKLRRGG